MKMKLPNLKNFLHEELIEAGCDEAGRGPLAGPVFAAAVILPKDFYHPLLDDSKKMTASHRNEVRKVIEKEAIAWAVEEISPEEIDELNILWASVTGMQRAVSRLEPAPDFLLIDGNKFRPFGKYKSTDYQTVVKGDATYAPIAAASVLAQDLPGRVHAKNREGVSPIRLGTQYGLPHSRAHRRHQEVRLHPLPPHEFPSETTGALVIRRIETYKC